MTETHSDLLAGLTDTDAAEFVRLAKPVLLASGQSLFNLGDRADSLYLVERGRVTLTLPLQIGGREEEVLVEERGPGQMVGWSALIPPHRFTLNARAPLESELLAFNRPALLDHFARRPDVAFTVTHNVACIVGQRLHVLQAMWLREVQHVVELRAV